MAVDPPARSHEPLLAAMYFAFYACSGAWVPYLAPYLTSRGFDAAAVGTTLAAMAAVRVLSGPLWGFAADVTRRTAGLLAVAAALGVASGAVTLWSTIPAWIAIFLMFGAASRAAISSLVDSITLRSLERAGRPDRYGPLRAWGSAGFLVSGGISGWLGEASPAVPLTFALLFLAVGGLLGRVLPEEAPIRRASVLPAIALMARSPRMLALWAAATLHGTALSSYDSFYAVHIGYLGLASRWTGASLVVGISAEIALFTVFRSVLRRGDPLVWVGLGCSVGALRWLATALLANPLVLTALSVTHAITFGAWWLGSIETLRRDLPEEIRASAQALLMATAYGIGPMACGLLAARVSNTVALYECAAGCSALAVVLVVVAAMLPRELAQSTSGVAAQR
jgi:PPP family 3-phenylpropionic acid transporter